VSYISLTVNWFHTHHFLSLVVYRIEKNEMGGACGAYGGGEKCAQGSGVEN